MILIGDCRDKMRELIADKVTVQMCVTSPPYFGLRSYGIGAENGEIGLEETPDAYVENMVAVFRLVRELLADDGTLWLNLGDSFATRHASGTTDEKTGWKHGKISRDCQGRAGGVGCNGLKPKDLIGIPWLVAFALRADGWYLRQDIIWHKPNAMPESVKDRCTKAHEYIFLLSKNAKYYYDAEAIKEDSVDKESYTGRRFRGRRAIYNSGCVPMPFKGRSFHSGNNQILEKKYEKRNKRSVWAVKTKPNPGWNSLSPNERNFAVFPPELIEPCILAGSSGKGECPECGRGWVRTEKKTSGFPETPGWKTNCSHGKYTCIACSIVIDYKKNNKEVYHSQKRRQTGQQDRELGVNAQNDTRQDNSARKKISSKLSSMWVSFFNKRTCPICSGKIEFEPYKPVPQTVLDIFFGSGTTGEVAQKFGRKFIGVDLNPNYKKLQKERTAALGLALY